MSPIQPTSATVTTGSRPPQSIAVRLGTARQMASMVVGAGLWIEGRLLRRGALIQHAITVAVLAYWALAAYPAHYWTAAPGLDPSWIDVLNRRVNESVWIGIDIFFTYGPLGFLLQPMAVSDRLLYVVWFRSAFWLLFVAVAIYLAYHQRNTSAVWLFAITYVIALMGGLQFDYTLTLVVALLVVIGDRSRVFGPVAFVLAGFLSGALPFTKLSTGVVASIVFGVGIVTTLIISRGQQWRRCVLSAGIAVATFLTLALLFMGSPSNVLRWLAVTSEITSGYDIAMTIPIPVWYLALGLVVLISYAALFLLTILTRSSVFWPLLALGVTVLISFKHGFVRNTALFFPTALAGLSLAFLVTTTRREERWLSVAYLVALVCTLAVGTSAPRAWITNSSQVLPGLTATDRFSALYNYPQFYQELNSQGVINLERDRLPDEWVQLMLKEHATVDVIPWEVGFITANGLRWRPNPLMQTYVAYTSALDRLSAEHYTGISAPEYVLAEWVDLEGKNPLVSNPATWRAILERYELLGHLSPAERLQLNAAPSGPWPLALFHKRSQPLDLSPQRTTTETVSIDQPIRVPPVSQGLAARLDLRLAPYGQLVKLLWGISSVSLTVTLESGRTFTFRVIPDTLKNGIMLAPYLVSPEDLANLAGPQQRDRVVALQLSGPGLQYYRETLPVTWEEVAWLKDGVAPHLSPAPVTSGQAVPAPPLAAVYAADTPVLWRPGETKTYRVTVTNTSTSIWPSTGSAVVGLGVYFGADNDALEGWATDQRFPLPHDLAPGQSVAFDVAIVAPQRPGAYVLHHRMVHETVAWSTRAQRTPVQVRP